MPKFIYDNPPTYKVTAIVSVYKAERFLQACLEDLIAQSIFEQVEVIIIDANSPENEKAIAENFTQQYSNIIYIRTSEREGLYASWNRALKIANGEYITNANADDRHAKHAFERLSKELDTNPAIALAYANCRITNVENALFHSAPTVGSTHWLPYDHINLLRRCEMGPQPMWRRCIHEHVGFFDESFTVTGDYDMWLRLSEHYPMRHITEELGLYLRYDNNLENQNPAHTQKECIQAQSNAIKRFMADDFTPHIPLDKQWETHRHRLNRYVCNLENGNNIKNLQKLAFHVYAYILLSAKMKKEQINPLWLSEQISPLQQAVSLEYIKKLLA